MSDQTVFTRRDKTNYYLDLAEVVSERSTCIRRHYGAVIVKDDEVISTGYVGAPRGRANCNELGYCTRERLQVPRGERYELCRSVHAEANAIISAARSEMIGSSLYLVGKEVTTGDYIKEASSCAMCKRLIINAGIKYVYIRDTRDQYRKIEVQDWIVNDESIEGSYGY
ncbi:MAG TPA: dCMP deaminase family protein [Bacillota bacterium]|jgi:dCMP deaminase|nr:dCMP deaminase family protein [Fastidiosipila sp.]HPX93448.1 dCMP deaminase family protein [Bacillota bacterium]HQB81220.1 dCMP deaminase family protein [Bacillota bacterium]